MADALWLKCVDELKYQVPDNIFTMWIRPLSASMHDNTMVVNVPNQYFVSYVEKNYLSQIQVNKWELYQIGRYCDELVPAGVEAADLFSSSMQWAGMNEKKSLWYGAFFGSGLQLAIEMKDAYAPYWGFSKWDLALGSTGSFWPVAQYYNDDLKAINFKFSYYKRSNIYWELDRQRGKETNKYAWQDDYPNQTYWITFDVNHFTETCCWPDWLNVAIGFGLDDTQYLNEHNTKTGGNNARTRDKPRKTRDAVPKGISDVQC